jgi:hypothetical protein
MANESQRQTVIGQFYQLDRLVVEGGISVRNMASTVYFAFANIDLRARIAVARDRLSGRSSKGTFVASKYRDRKDGALTYHADMTERIKTHSTLELYVR